jgi:hypothetical protein
VCCSYRCHFGTSASKKLMSFLVAIISTVWSVVLDFVGEPVQFYGKHEKFFLSLGQHEGVVSKNGVQHVSFPQGTEIGDYLDCHGLILFSVDGKFVLFCRRGELCGDPECKKDTCVVHLDLSFLCGCSMCSWKEGMTKLPHDLSPSIIFSILELERFEREEAEYQAMKAARKKASEAELDADEEIRTSAERWFPRGVARSNKTADLVRRTEKKRDDIKRSARKKRAHKERRAERDEIAVQLHV